jgi:hypothetical protein
MKEVFELSRNMKHAAIIFGLLLVLFGHTPTVHAYTFYSQLDNTNEYIQKLSERLPVGTFVAPYDYSGPVTATVHLSFLFDTWHGGTIGIKEGARGVCVFEQLREPVNDYPIPARMLVSTSDCNMTKDTVYTIEIIPSSTGLNTGYLGDPSGAIAVAFDVNTPMPALPPDPLIEAPKTYYQLDYSFFTSVSSLQPVVAEFIAFDSLEVSTYQTVLWRHANVLEIISSQIVDHTDADRVVCTATSGVHVDTSGFYSFTCIAPFTLIPGHTYYIKHVVSAEHNDGGSEMYYGGSGLVDPTNGKNGAYSLNMLGGISIQNTTPDPVFQLEPVTDLQQFKSDGQYAIQEGDVTNDSVVVLQAKIHGAQPAKLEVELKKSEEEFNASDLLISDIAQPDTFATVTQGNLTSLASYKWRAREISEDGLSASDWAYFGDATVSDFKVQLVELYTQVKSPYPNLQDTEEWAKEQYANGSKTCPTIAACGCYLTASVMMLRYYGITSAFGEDVNPKTLNAWLNNHNGYVGGNNVNSYKVAEYSGSTIKFTKKTDYKEGSRDFTLADTYLTKGQPVIVKQKYNAYSKKQQKVLEHTHFIVLDNKLATTYGVKDPAYFDTKSLANTDILEHTKNYDNKIYGYRIYEPNPSGLASSAISFTLGSPAELLVTDTDGRKLGKDPLTGIVYNDIPEGDYSYDEVASVDEDFVEHETKVITIPNPKNGEYTLQVIGTGAGSYSLNTTLANTDGTVDTKDLIGVTQPSQIDTYKVVYTGNDPTATMSESSTDKDADITLSETTATPTIVGETTGNNPPITPQPFMSQGVVSLAFLHDGRSAPKVLGTEIKNDALLTEEPKSKSKPSVVKSKIQKTKTKKKSTILKSEKQVSVVAAIPHTPEVDKQEFEGKKENWFTKLWNKIMKKQNHD